MHIERLPINEDPDDVGDFLAGFGIDWDAAAAVADAENTAQHSQIDIGRAEEDFSYIKDSEVPIIDGDRVFRALETAALPKLTPLKLSPKETEYLETPIMDAYGVHCARAEIKRMVLNHSDELNVDRDVVIDMLLPLTEALSNGLFYGGGVRRVVLAKTPYNNLLFGVQNYLPENVDEPREQSRSRQENCTAAIGNLAVTGRGLEDQSELTDEIHQRGLFLLAAASINGMTKGTRCGFKPDRTISAGITRLPAPALQKIARFENVTGQDLCSDTVHTFVWGVFGLDTKAAREADALTIEVDTVA